MVHVDETGKTTFRFRHGTPGPVFLVGDFCRWQKDHLPMRRVSEHEWMLMLRLPPGNYEFRYYAQDQWFTDYAAFGVNPNHFKEFNSVLRVPKVRAAALRLVRVARPLGSRMAVSA
jgi:1,4-alpha-glucan branching enzyme